MHQTPNKEHVMIMGTTIEIVIDDERCDEEEADGLYTAETIYLKSSYPSFDEYKRVYAHECIHALCEILGAQLDHNLEEILAHRISTMIVFEI